MPNLKSSPAKAFRLPLIALIITAPLAWFAWTAYAASRTWDGGGGAANIFWTFPANWQFDLAPQPGDDLILPAGAQPNSFNNFASGTTFNTLNVSGGHFMQGNSIALTAGLTAANGRISVSSLKLNNSQTFTAPTAGTGALIESAVDLGSAANTLTINGPGNFIFSGSMNTGGFVKNGSGAVTLTGAAATLSDTFVNDGLLQLSKTGGSLASNRVLVVGDGVGNGASAVAILGASTQTHNHITVNSDGLYDLNGLNNTTTELTVNGGSVTIGAGTLTTSAGANTFMTGGSISATGAGKLLLGGNVTTFAAPTTAAISGNLDLGGTTRTFNIADGAPSLDLDVIAGISNGGLTKTGTGFLLLRANNTYTGPTTLSAGRLAIDGAQPQSAVTVQGGEIGGRGTVGSINATGGTVRPGNLLHLNVQGNLTLAPAVTYLPISAWPTPNNDGVLNVTGTVNLGGSNLDLQFASPPSPLTPLQNFKILINSGDQPVQGTFNGLPEGSTFTKNGTTYYITYAGGDGNDVVLHVPTTRTWDGGSTVDSNWTTAANWVGDVAPQVGDNLVFPQNATRKVNSNDFPNGTTFTSITFSGGGYQLRSAISNSNNINLTAGITDNNASSDSTENNSISLAIGGAGGVTKNGAGFLGLLSSNNTYTGVTAINGGTLSITGTQPSSPVNVNGGTLSGAGVTGAITANSGTVSPGFNLRANGVVIFNSAVTYSVRFVPNDNDISVTKLSVTGTVNLGNSTLNSTHNNAPAMGNAFVIVENDGADAVTGTFSGLAEGAIFTISRADGTDPLIFRISYHGGTGNDVTVTRVAPPAFSVDDVSINEGNSGQNNATFTVRRSETIANASATVNYGTADGTATGMAPPPDSRDYVSTSGTLTFNPGEASKTINVPIFGDIVNEADETFFVTLSNPSNATIGDGQGVGTIRNDDQNSIVQFGAASFSVTEASTGVPVTVTRTGDTSGASEVDYASSDIAGLINCNVINGMASSRCDYATSVGTLRFASGETSKTISIPIVDDAYAEGNESFTITLSSRTGVVLGTPASATVTINDNETVNGPNPIDQTSFFVRQHYVDFLGREPDPPGFAAWQAIINNCPPNDTSCDRIHVSSAFFRSPEFQERGYFVYRFYPVAFERKPDYVEFIPDLAKVSGFLTNSELEAAKLAFVAEFMSRQAFMTKYDGLNNTQYVDTLLLTANVTSNNRDAWINALSAGTKTRAEVLREIAESTEVYDEYYNQAFVVMQYFGYLRRDPDALYLNWIQELDTTNNFRTMVNGFMNSPEYRLRFGP